MWGGEITETQAERPLRLRGRGFDPAGAIRGPADRPRGEGDDDDKQQHRPPHPPLARRAGPPC